MSALHISCPQSAALYIVNMKTYGIGTLGTILNYKLDNFKLNPRPLSLPMLTTFDLKSGWP